jgi:phosphatidylglycerophosphatase A
LSRSRKRRLNSPESAAPKSAKDSVAFVLATCIVGLIPFAPGTWGSAVGVGLFWLLNAGSERLYFYALDHRVTLGSALSVRNSLLLIATMVVTYAGIWAATLVERRTKLKDPGIVVIDEVAGQLITYLFIPLAFGPWTLLVGFLAFRLFDIWKPYPIRNLEVLESGLGIMADDVLAGLYAAVLLSALVALRILA